MHSFVAYMVVMAHPATAIFIIPVVSHLAGRLSIILRTHGGNSLEFGLMMQQILLYDWLNSVSNNLNSQKGTGIH